MAAGTKEKLERLDISLEAFKPTDNVSKETGAMYAALLAEVKKEHADDPVVAVIEPPGLNSIGRPMINAGGMRAAIAQLLAVYDDDSLV